MPLSSLARPPAPLPGSTTPLILFGAFDRHNFGDLLFPHIASILLGRHDLIYAGLAAIDLQEYGGHRVSALASLAAHWDAQPVNLIHVGGEILTCDAWQAAIMLQPAEEVQATIARLDRQKGEKQIWARQQLGLPVLAPYTLSRRHFPQVGKVIYASVGGVALTQIPAAMQTEVLTNLRAADAIGVRDRWTLAELHAADIPARLIPDPASMVAELFGEQIRLFARTGEPAQVMAAFPQGYMAIQFSADFGDDATLASIAAQLDLIAAERNLGIVFFRAGAAPWHDELTGYQRVASRLQTKAVHLFISLNIWDICALIAGSRIYCGSSLHGRIIAMAFARPRLNLTHSEAGLLPSKQAAYARTWDTEGIPATVKVSAIADGIRQALAIPQITLEHTAKQLAALYRNGFAAIHSPLDPTDPSAPPSRPV